MENLINEYLACRRKAIIAMKKGCSLVEKKEFDNQRDAILEKMTVAELEVLESNAFCMRDRMKFREFIDRKQANNTSYIEQ